MIWYDETEPRMVGRHDAAVCECGFSHPSLDYEFARRLYGIQEKANKID
jgi:hypothetical protein